MTNLANANLLDDSVANSGSLKNQRINKTAKTAINPKPIQEEEVQEEEDNDSSYNTQDRMSVYEKQSKIASKSTKSEPSKEDNKILGMKPALFYGLLAVGVIVGGVIVYNKFIKNGKKGLPKPDVGANTGSPNTAPNTSV